MFGKIALCACSNLLPDDERGEMRKLKSMLERFGVTVAESPCMYADGRDGIGLGKRKADILNRFYADQSIDAVFDVSGGDTANELLPYLDYDLIGRSGKPFFGYSDLTTVLNAIYAKTGKSSVLFQIRSLVWDETGIQADRFERYLRGDKELFSPRWNTLQGTGEAEKLKRNNTTVGGNIRCFLKLAGTGYFPNTEGKLLFLEALGGGIPQLSTYFAALEQLGVFNKVSGILLGTFTQLEKERGGQCVYDILKQHISHEMFVAKTQDVGHGNSARALTIG